MGTRSRIGLQFADGSIFSAYHHWDGYPEGLGLILKTQYYSKAFAFVLISGGDMSSCWTKDRWDDSADGTYGPQYYSQRGEDCPPRLYADLCEYLLPDNSEEYAYLFSNGEWVCYDMHQFEDDKLPELVPIPSSSASVPVLGPAQWAPIWALGSPPVPLY